MTKEAAERQFRAVARAWYAEKARCLMVNGIPPKGARKLWPFAVSLGLSKKDYNRILRNACDHVERQQRAEMMWWDGWVCNAEARPAKAA